ncbi:MAG: cytochrome C oxidase subunit IV family protein [bacterium]
MASKQASAGKYVLVYVLLIGLLTLSIPATFYDSGTISTLIIYGVAVSKAYLVLRIYMHLNLEPRFITLIMAGCFIAMVYMFFLLYPDIVWNGMAAL